jgi:hypothetical protein
MIENSNPPTKRNLRVVKWLRMTPAVAVCTLCSREFKVPMGALRRTTHAQANLQQQFDTHKCQSDESKVETHGASHAKTKIDTEVKAYGQGEDPDRNPT